MDTLFDPSEYGFEVVSGVKSGGVDYPYLHISWTKDTPVAMMLRLDKDTTDMCRDLFGERAGVAINQIGLIVLYVGNSRKLSTNAKKPSKAAISLDTEISKILAILGKFSDYKYKTKIYADGQAVLLSPVSKIR